ncbi:unnamed protein product [Rhizoctonia solani]|uniref:Protein kinase domain-containing protein n=1 Tax=Rhizoctonia solani TaxID=456999 RepID=A0A8H3AWH4_9AGAM|nr:unnamed protein product [Rhizoctonia solani]
MSSFRDWFRRSSGSPAPSNRPPAPLVAGDKSSASPAPGDKSSRTPLTQDSASHINRGAEKYEHVRRTSAVGIGAVGAFGTFVAIGSPHLGPIEVGTPGERTPDNEAKALAPLAIQCALSIAEVAAELAPVPYIGPLVKCLTAVFQAVERSKANKEQWKLLQGRCVMVLRIAGAQVTNHGEQHYPRINEASEMLENTLKKIQRQAQQYSEMSGVETFFRHQLISSEIEGLFSELDECLRMFSYAADVAQAQWIGEFRAVQEQEARDIRQLTNELEKMGVIVKGVDSKGDQILEKVEHLEKIAVAFEKMLLNKSSILREQSPTTTVNDYVDAQQIVRIILTITKLQLPPKLLLGRQCILESKVPIKTGMTCDVYLASFLGGEKVAKKVFRLGISEKEYVEKYAARFLRIASLWCDLRSEYTLPFYGIGMEPLERADHFQLYMVSPLMKNYDAMAYLKQYRRNAGMKKNILRIITDAARGLKALESEENSKLPPAVMTGKTESQRWMAPEMLEDDPILKTPCDVWGWAMTALEIVSGSIPYYKYKQPMAIVRNVMAGPPKREDYPEFNTYAHRPNEMWELLLACWNMEPKERPDMDDVLAKLKKIAKMPEESA